MRDPIGRRAFLIGGSALLGITRRADGQARVRRVVWLGDTYRGTAVDPLEALRRALREAGYVEGQNLAINVRSPEGRPELLVQHANDLARQDVDAIIASSTQAARAAMAATKRIPIVFTFVTDPIGAGLVASLARPGGNVTGVATGQDSLIGKYVQFLREIVPGLSRLAVLLSAPGAKRPFPKLEAAIKSVGGTLHIRDIETVEGFDSSFADMARGGMQAVIVWTSPLLFAHKERIAASALRHGLPTLTPAEAPVRAGLLMCYMPNFADALQRLGVMTAKILGGVKPADLPVDEPERVRLVINLKTARALRLTVPQSLVLRADEVIE